MCSAPLACPRGASTISGVLSPRAWFSCVFSSFVIICAPSSQIGCLGARSVAGSEWRYPLGLRWRDPNFSSPDENRDDLPSGVIAFCSSQIRHSIVVSMRGKSRWNLPGMTSRPLWLRTDLDSTKQQDDIKCLRTCTMPNGTSHDHERPDRITAATVRCGVSQHGDNKEPNCWTLIRRGKWVFVSQERVVEYGYCRDSTEECCEWGDIR